jgi:hypothetical protein
MNSTTMTIATGQNASLCNIRGATVHVREGCVWITQDGSTADEIVQAGRSFTVTRNGMTVFTACRPGPVARVRVDQPLRTEPTLTARMIGALAGLLPAAALR